MAGELAKAAAEEGTKAVMDLSLAAGAFSFSLKIDNVWLAGAVTVGALSLGAFYLACKGPLRMPLEGPWRDDFSVWWTRKLRRSKTGIQFSLNCFAAQKPLFCCSWTILKRKQLSFDWRKSLKKSVLKQSWMSPSEMRNRCTSKQCK